jgi:hypothetical protein
MSLIIFGLDCHLLTIDQIRWLKFIEAQRSKIKFWKKDFPEQINLLRNLKLSFYKIPALFCVSSK